MVVDSGFSGLTYYVNTASSAGGDGTTNATAGANRAFPTLLNAIQSLFGTGAETFLGAPCRILCSGTAADTSSLTSTNWDPVGTTATNYLLIQGDNRSGVWSTSHYRIEVSNSSLIYNNHVPHLRLDALQGKVSTNAGAECNIFRIATNGTVGTTADSRVSNCIAWGVATGGTNNITGFRMSAYNGTPPQGTRHWNCLAYDCENGFESDQDEAIQYNCTGYGCLQNFVGGQVTINCLSANMQNIAGFLACGDGGGASKNNASDDNSQEGPNGQNGSFTFVNEASDDFRLSPSDTVARNNGFTNPASGLYTDDIAGTDRGGSGWSIGMHEPA